MWVHVWHLNMLIGSHLTVYVDRVASLSEKQPLGILLLALWSSGRPM